jgi:hypothetical protein
MGDLSIEWQQFEDAVNRGHGIEHPILVSNALFEAMHSQGSIVGLNHSNPIYTQTTKVTSWTPCTEINKGAFNIGFTYKGGTGYALITYYLTPKNKKETQ